jgi:4-hydroxy-2-oxoheptanedioate aldolase
VKKVRYPRGNGFKGVTGDRGVAYSVRAAGYGAFGGADCDAYGNEHVALVVMIESLEAVNAAAEMATVDGVDAVFIGPNDLAHSMGHENRFNDPAVQAAMEKAVRAIASTGKCAGILALTPEDEKRYASWGATYFASVITAVLTKALKDAAHAGRSAETGKLSY